MVWGRATICKGGGRLEQRVKLRPKQITLFDGHWVVLVMGANYSKDQFVGLESQRDALRP